MKQLSKFAKFTWFVLAYNLFIILWGAYVRASGSGAGCGAHWPLCNGVVIPRAPAIETVIELTHRVTSGLTLILALILVLQAYKHFSKEHLVRKSARWVAVFMVIEALVGAVLVLFELTAQNESMARAYVMMLHLVNTFLLVGSIGLTAWWASIDAPEQLERRAPEAGLLIGGIVGMCILGASGAITALGDTLYPAASLAEGIQQDFSPTASILLRLRVFHPLIAATVGVYLGGVAFWLRRKYSQASVAWFCNALMGLFFVQLVLGVINVLLMAPIWMQIVHLLASQLVWLFLVLLTAVIFGSGDFTPGLIDEKRVQRIDQPKGVG